VTSVNELVGKDCVRPFITNEAYIISFI